jgi:thioredoxin-like negative regulator of GroEL
MLTVLFFYKDFCNLSDKLDKTLNSVVKELDFVNLKKVDIDKNPIACRYGIKTSPALIYLKNGEYLAYSATVWDHEVIVEKLKYYNR